MSELEILQAASRSELLDRWQNMFHREPPARLHNGLLRGVLAWHIQCQANGIDPLGEPGKAATSAAEPTLRAGARLLREWHGSTYEVLVVPQGFQYAGKTYKSLSSVARTITGTPWSGPAFFGIKRK